MADNPSASEPVGYDEKKEYMPANPPKGPAADDEEEDADMDALIEELESHDGGADDFEEGQEDASGNLKQVPDDMLQTSTVSGLTNEEVLARRRKYGINAMKEERVSRAIGAFDASSPHANKAAR